MEPVEKQREGEGVTTTDGETIDGDQFVYQFGPFQLRPAEQLLLRDEEPVALPYRAVAVLVMLLERAGQLIEKEELLSTVWKDCYVEEGNLTVTISSLRKALGDPRNEQHYIKTVSGHGYRFVGDVSKRSKSAADSYYPRRLRGILPPAQALVTEKPSTRPWEGFSFAALSAAAVLLGALSIFWLGPDIQSLKAASPEMHSLAVVPFRNASPSEGSSKLDVEIADELISSLVEGGGIAVRPTESVLKYVNRNVDPLTAGKEQKVDAVLTGTIIGLDGRLKVSAQLLRVNDGAVVWQGTFDKPLNQAFDLEEQLKEGVAKAFSPASSAVHSPAVRTPDPEAHRLYLEGRYFWNKRSEDGFRKSTEDFQSAVLKDPSYALAYAGLADSYSALAVRNVKSAQEEYPRAEAAAVEALELDNSLAEPHATLGKISFYYEWNWTKAEREFRRAIQLNPNLAVSHAWYAAHLAASDRLDQALMEARRAQELDPVSAAMNAELGWVYYFDRQYDQAVETFRHAIELDPQFATAYSRLGKTYLMQKKYPEALRELREAKLLYPHNLEIDGLLGYAEAASGNTAEARRMLADLHQLSSHQFVPSCTVALIYMALGDRDKVFDALSKARQERSSVLVFARIDPLFDSLRSDPRFSALLRTMGQLQDTPQYAALAR